MNNAFMLRKNSRFGAFLIKAGRENCIEYKHCDVMTGFGPGRFSAAVFAAAEWFMKHDGTETFHDVMLLDNRFVLERAEHEREDRRKGHGRLGGFFKFDKNFTVTDLQGPHRRQNSTRSRPGEVLGGRRLLQVFGDMREGVSPNGWYTGHYAGGKKYPKLAMPEGVCNESDVYQPSRIPDRRSQHPSDVNVMTKRVSCGGHFAPNCKKCPRNPDNGQWIGQAWCNGNCKWVKYECVLK